MPVFQKTIQDEAGNVMPGASVEVRDQVTSGLVQLYSNFALSSTIGNPTTADGDGFVRFYVAPGRYRIVASLGGQSRTWEDEVLGQIDGAGIQYVRTAAEIAGGVTPGAYQYPAGDIRRYGAVGDGTTNNETAWAAANSQASQTGGAPIYVPKSASGFGTASALTVAYNADLVAEAGARLIYTGSSNIVCLTFGDTTNVAHARKWVLPAVERTNQSNWSNEGAVGVRFRNTTMCHIEVPLISGYTIGLQTLPAGGNGFQHNKIYVGALYNNKIAIDCSNVTAGYTNENTWFGGRFTVFTGVNNTLARYAIRVTSSDTSYLFNNNNVFLHPSIELNEPDTSGEAIPILMEHGQQNRFLYCRDEINSTTFARESNAATCNHYDTGYFASTATPIVDSSSSAPVWLATNSGLGAVFSTNLRRVFDSGPLHKNWNNYDGATGSVHIPGVHLGFSGSGSTVFVASTGVTPNAAYLDITGGGVGVFVNCNEVKQFIVSRQADTSRGGRIVVVCYDAIDGGGSIITTAGSVKGSGSTAFTASGGTYGGCFTTGSDANDDVVFTVTAAVKSVRVLVVAGTATLRIRQFEIYSFNTQATAGVYCGYSQIAPGQAIGTAIPTSGTYATGQFLRNVAPSVDGSNMAIQGWLCTAGGTPGTWAVSRTSTVSPAT
jgi:hypothetical protein